MPDYIPPIYIVLISLTFLIIFILIYWRSQQNVRTLDRLYHEWTLEITSRFDLKYERFASVGLLARRISYDNITILDVVILLLGSTLGYFPESPFDEKLRTDWLRHGRRRSKDFRRQFRTSPSKLSELDKQNAFDGLVGNLVLYTLQVDCIYKWAKMTLQDSSASEGRKRVAERLLALPIQSLDEYSGKSWNSQDCTKKDQTRTELYRRFAYQVLVERIVEEGFAALAVRSITLEDIQSLEDRMDKVAKDYCIMKKKLYHAVVFASDWGTEIVNVLDPKADKLLWRDDKYDLNNPTIAEDDPNRALFCKELMSECLRNGLQLPHILMVARAYNQWPTPIKKVSEALVSKKDTLSSVVRMAEQDLKEIRSDLGIS